jgi:integrase/recombinase XerD
MSALFGHLEDYLRLRRALGFKLERAGLLLPQFVAYLEQAGAATVTTELAVRWASLPRQARPNYWAARLAVVRGFARYLQTLDPAAQVPPLGVFPTSRYRPAPYLWSRDDVCHLLEAARALRPALRAATYEAFFGLLASTGMRVGEAIDLEGDDVDLAAGLVRARHPKFDRERLVPLHPSVTDALRIYARQRDRLCPKPRSTAFFISSTGTALSRCCVDTALRQLTTMTGLRSASTRPRAHDLRHSFAVETLVGWYRSGADIDANIVVLSTYLGHLSPAGTYWYLSAVPELMSLAAERLGNRNRQCS